VKLSGSVFMGARGAYVCTTMDNQIVCTNG